MQDSTHARSSVGMMKLAPQYGSFLLGALEEPAGQPYGRAIAEVFDGGKLIVVRLSIRPMAAINSAQVVNRYVSETAIFFPFDADGAIGLAYGVEELRRLQVNIGLGHQNRIVLQADNQIPVLLEGLPKGIASLEDTVCDVDLEGFRVRVNSFGDEVIVEACFLGIVFVNIDLPKLAASADLDDACAGVDKPLFTFSVAFLDDSVEIVYGVRLILNRQRSGPLIGGQTFLQCELGVFLPVRGPASRAPSTAFFCRARFKASCRVPTGWGVPRSSFALPRAIPNSNLPASWKSVSPTLRARFARRFIFDLDGIGS